MVLQAMETFHTVLCLLIKDFYVIGYPTRIPSNLPSHSPPILLRSSSSPSTHKSERILSLFVNRSPSICSTYLVNKTLDIIAYHLCGHTMCKGRVAESVMSEPSIRWSCCSDSLLNCVSLEVSPLLLSHTVLLTDMGSINIH